MGFILKIIFKFNKSQLQVLHLFELKIKIQNQPSQLTKINPHTPKHQTFGVFL